MIFTILGAIFIGFFAGLIARAIFPGRHKSGFWLTVGIGIAGSIVATYLGEFIGIYAAGEKAGFIMSVVGAMIVLGLFGLLRNKN